jgi:hypothetical protein
LRSCFSRCAPPPPALLGRARSGPDGVNAAHWPLRRHRRRVGRPAVHAALSETAARSRRLPASCLRERPRQRWRRLRQGGSAAENVDGGPGLCRARSRFVSLPAMRYAYSASSRVSGRIAGGRGQEPASLGQVAGKSTRRAAKRLRACQGTRQRQGSAPHLQCGPVSCSEWLLHANRVVASSNIEGELMITSKSAQHGAAMRATTRRPPPPHQPLLHPQI